MPGRKPGSAADSSRPEPSALATWWCGEAPARAEVLDNLRNLVLKPTFPGRSSEVLFGDRLAEDQLDALAARIEAHPTEFVAQELVKLSRAPVWAGGHRRKLRPRAMGLRVYAAITPEGYSVLPGGLARVAGVDNTRILTLQKGGSNKKEHKTSACATFSARRTRFCRVSKFMAGWLPAAGRRRRPLRRFRRTTPAATAAAAWRACRCGGRSTTRARLRIR